METLLSKECQTELRAYLDSLDRIKYNKPDGKPGNWKMVLDPPKALASKSKWNMHKYAGRLASSIYPPEYEGTQADLNEAKHIALFRLLLNIGDEVWSSTWNKVRVSTSSNAIASSAASDAAFKAILTVAKHFDFDGKDSYLRDLDSAEKDMEVWRKGYCVAGRDANGSLQAYNGNVSTEITKSIEITKKDGAILEIKGISKFRVFRRREPVEE